MEIVCFGNAGGPEILPEQARRWIKLKLIRWEVLGIHRCKRLGSKQSVNKTPIGSRKIKTFLPISPLIWKRRKKSKNDLSSLQTRQQLSGESNRVSHPPEERKKSPKAFPTAAHQLPRGSPQEREREADPRPPWLRGSSLLPRKVSTPRISVAAVSRPGKAFRFALAAFEARPLSWE